MTVGSFGVGYPATRGALKITYTILGVPCYNYGIPYSNCYSRGPLQCGLCPF